MFSHLNLKNVQKGLSHASPCQVSSTLLLWFCDLLRAGLQLLLYLRSRHWLYGLHCFTQLYHWLRGLHCFSSLNLLLHDVTLHVYFLMCSITVFLSKRKALKVIVWSVHPYIPGAPAELDTDQVSRAICERIECRRENWK